MQYNYVFFDNGSIKNCKSDPDNYYYICTEDLRRIDGIKVVSYAMDWLPCIFHKINIFQKVAHLPLKGIWFPFYFKDDFKERKPYCFIVYGYYVRPAYLRYLKKKYPDCKIVKIHRDLIGLWRKRNPDYSDDDVKSLFDLTLTYDQSEAEKYGIPYFSEIESKISVDRNDLTISSDLFFAGNVKDRLPVLLQVYHQAVQKGLKCDFYLTGVRSESQVPLEGVTYAKKNMSYRDMLKRTISSKCILEINQGGAVGYTSRFLEAVMYGKKLLTNNMTIRGTKFFRSDYIQCFENVNSIDFDFINKDVGTIDYGYKNEFSPIHLIEQIEGLLTNGK